MAIKPTANQGDIHVSDTGEFLATIDTDQIPNAQPIPTEIDLYIDGYIYTYSMYGRRKDETEEEAVIDKFKNL